MNTTTFDTEKAIQVETAVCSEFGFCISDIVSYRDAIAKKVVVFILSKHFGCDKRVLAVWYRMSYLYVPTVVTEMEYLIKTVPSFERKINEVLKNCANEKILDTAGIRDFATALS